MNFIKKLKDNNELSWVGLVFIVQYNNYKSIPKFINLCKTLNFEPVFSKLLNWGTFSEETYKLYDVCNPEHKNYNELKNIVSKVVSKNKDFYINWGNIV